MPGSGVPRGHQVEALALCGNAVLFAGRIVNAKAGTKNGFLRIVSSADGKKIAEFSLDAPPTYDGLAVAHGKVFLSLQNGSLICVGK